MSRDAKSLTTYRAKRDFTKTAEPSGRTAVQPSAQLRYVIQKHAASHLHFDLRLEMNGVFKSWAVTKGPSIDPLDKRLAVEVEDHPLDYGDFEGTIPQGEYGGGTVQLWDRGFWAPEGGRSPEDALKSGDLKFVLAGKRLQGSWVLVRIKHNRGRDTRTNWLLIKHRDEYAKPGGTAALMALDRSVASGRSMAQIGRGSGKPPESFMLSARLKSTADAVWHSAKQAQSAASKSAAKTTEEKPSRAARATTPRGVRRSTMPGFIEPQLAKLVDRPPGQPGWAHEVKFDGYRVQLHVEKHRATLRTRSGIDWTAKFEEVAAAAKPLGDCIIDGEVVALDAHGMPSFAALQAALSEHKTQDLILFAFDLLFSGKEDLRPLALSQRKERLKALLGRDDAGRVRYVEHFETGADAVLESACKMHLEGIVSKKLDASYVSGRSGMWTKSKCRAGHEVVLGGWTTENGTLRSLLAGVNRDGHLVYVGRIGTGYGGAVVTKVLPTLKKLTTDKNPFGGEGAPRHESNIRWLKPTLVAEIEFAGWTATGMIRQAAFKGLRTDKPAAEVVAELPTPVAEVTSDPDRLLAAGIKAQSTSTARGTAKAKSPSHARAKAPAHRTPARAAPGAVTSPGTVVVMGVPLSKADKAFWPDAGDGKSVTKLDLARYYEAVGEWMMPHLIGRPCSLLRAPDGIGGQQFFQRHAMSGMSSLLSTVKVRGDKAPYVQIDRREALASIAQIGALELHPWNCAEGRPEVAGRLVFDLDPAPDVSFDAVITAALEIRERLAAVGLESFCKTTGGKGLHVVTPLADGKQAVAWPEAKSFAHIVCAQMAADAPTRYLDTMSKAQRTGRIFLDYLRNDRTATAVAVLSTRARDGATISMPLRWKDVRRGLDPKQFTVRTAPAQLVKTKPWADYTEGARSLEAAIRKVVAKTEPNRPRTRQ